MLCLWWNWKGVLYYEFLPENQIIHSNKYFSQLDQLKATLEQKASRYLRKKKHQPRFIRIYVDIHCSIACNIKKIGKNSKFHVLWNISVD